MVIYTDKGRSHQMKISVEETKLKTAFKNSGYKYQELADALGISCSYCYKLINNHHYKKKISYNLASRIANVLKSDVVDLFEEQVDFF
ncbi:putative helix-turn-helix transcriptional protein [Bacillus phage vB_BanS_Booya]|uniref:Helix-turn-helix transcriptional protein n=1 Tax=Bacillus phage vB_BanS_Booya TaxID=2894778 RepID=A0AAE8YWF6_9CAUD|nr:putative helix-turn-helix transcriptional protein [Bacillus phage vB_BanS_Booya]UGO51580.1 putative helix-turn-helix transcriptional protein [Bacillus phage vB_BanS_Booya]